MEDRQCNKLNSVAYSSCIDSYFESKDRNDIYEYWLYLQEAKRFCEADGVMKALELIEIILYLKANGKT
tara:strand:- start:192 stop:398 length:207 start_codon:yes stop_codon:yes gene_type:complete